MALGPATTHEIGALPDSLRSALRGTSASGVQLRYLQVGTGHAVVFLHTLRTQLEMYRGVIDRLDRTKVHAVALDLPGHGHAGAPNVAYTVDFFSDIVAGFLVECEVHGATLVGESIGATIALSLAARRNDRVGSVIAINPYDYGRWGGIRRSSPAARVLFTAILWPAIGPLVAHGETRQILRTVMRGGVHDKHALSAELIEELYRSGGRPGHARALRSLSREWRSFVRARHGYARIEVPVTLVYGENDWSRPGEREANQRAIAGARLVTIKRCGHFATLDRPDAIAGLIASERQ